jgi:hypothetical protein
LLDAHPEVGFVYGRALWTIDGVPLPAARQKVRGWSVWPGQWWIEQRFRQAENPIISPELIVRTALQHKVGGYSAELPRAADMEMYMRLAANADVGFIRGADQAYYRVHLSNMSKGVSPLMDLCQRRSVFEVVLERDGDKLRNPAHLSDVVHRALAREALWAAARVYDRGRLRRTELARRFLGVGAAEDDHDVVELLAFAVDCWRDVERLELYRTLQSGTVLGPRAVEYMLAQKAKWWLHRRSWKYRGY